MIPLPIFKKGVAAILDSDKAYVFYMHPWEVDPEQPRVREASRGYRFRHYVNLDRTFSKLKGMIESFVFCQFVTCRRYLG